MRFARTEVRTADHRGPRGRRDRVTATAIMVGETRVGSIRGWEGAGDDGPAYVIITTRDPFWDGFGHTPYFDSLEAAKTVVRAQWRVYALSRWA